MVDLGASECKEFAASVRKIVSLSANGHVNPRSAVKLVVQNANLRDALCVADHSNLRERSVR